MSTNLSAVLQELLQNTGPQALFEVFAAIQRFHSDSLGKEVEV